MSAVLTRDEPVPPAPSIATVHPAKGWYVVFGGLVVVSLLAGLGIWFMGKRSVENTIASYARFVGPNTADLRFKRAGQYLVYYEYDSTIDGERIEAPPTPPPGIALDLKDEAGESLELRRVGREFRYDTGEHRAVSLRRVTIPREGLYQLSALAPGLDQFVIAVGRGSTPTTDASTRTAVLVGSIGALLGVIGLVTVGILRSRSRAGLNVSVPVPWSPEPALTAEPMPTPPPPPPVTGPVPTIPPAPARAGDSGPVPVTPAPDAPTATGPTPTPPPPPPAPPGPGSAPGRAGPGGWAPPAAGTATAPGGTSPVPPPGALPPPPA